LAKSSTQLPNKTARKSFKGLGSKSFFVDQNTEGGEDTAESWNGTWDDVKARYNIGRTGEQ
jgi:hypothetical protein